MKKYLQIYIGGISGRDVSYKEMEERLETASLEKNDGIIVGWSLNKEIYVWLREYTRLHQLELYLWFQVFSEFSSLKKFSPIKEIKGDEIKSITFDRDEEFSFYCPSNKKTISYLKEIYEEHFEKIGFDGVFLDRIRFPSLAFDEKALFSCCCETCMEKYEKMGITKEEIVRIKIEVDEKKCKKSILDISDYQAGKYSYQTKTIQNYLAFRTELITEQVENLSNYFKTKGMKVGLDLFAPFLAEFVGQNYEKLSRCADFVKPMLYRYTDTPAGMRYELKGFVKALSCENRADEKLKHFKTMIGMEDAEITQFMIREVKAAIKMSHCEVLVGMEIHTIPDLPSISAIQIREGIETLEEIKVSGRIASWNLLVAEDDNIRAFMGRRY